MQEVASKRKLTPADGAHIFYTFIFLAGTYMVKSTYNTECGDSSVLLGAFIDILFYGLLIWETFLIVSLLPRYRNENLRQFFNILDLLYGLFHISMVIFALTILGNKKADDCVQLAPQAYFITQVYTIITGSAALIVIVGFGMWAYRKFCSTTDLNELKDYAL